MISDLVSFSADQGAETMKFLAVSFQVGPVASENDRKIGVKIPMVLTVSVRLKFHCGSPWLADDAVISESRCATVRQSYYQTGTAGVCGIERLRRSAVEPDVTGDDKIFFE